MTDYFGALGTALYSKLTGGTALVAALGGSAVYSQQAPDSQAYPYVVYSHTAGGLEYQTSANLRNNVWFVRAYTTNLAQAGTIDGLIADLLDKQALSLGASLVQVDMHREEDLQLVENAPDGSRVYMNGGYYRIRVTGG